MKKIHVDFFVEVSHCALPLSLNYWGNANFDRAERFTVSFLCFHFQVEF